MAENQQQNTNEVGLPNSHGVTLQKLLSQLDTLNVTEGSKPRLREALTAAISALQQTSGGVELSQGSAMEYLVNLVSGEDDRATAKAERQRDAVMTLAALVDQERHQEPDESDPVAFLADLIRQNER